MKRRRVAYLADALLVREQSHRRVVLVAIGGLLLFSTAPLFGHHLAEQANLMLAGVEHLGAICLTALHLLLAPVHALFHLLLISGLVYASYDRFRAWRSLRRLLTPLHAEQPHPGDAFWRAAAGARLPPERVLVVDGLPSPAFTAGWWRSRIYVARVLAQRLSDSELAAVLAHEAAHATRQDPLRLSLMRFFACTLFWIPALRRLADDMADEAEVEADDRAAQQDPLVLASAILALAHWMSPRSRAVGAAGFYHPDLVARRVRRLAGESTPFGTHLTLRSLAGAAFALALMWTSGIMMAHPLTGDGERHHTRHCDHGGAFPLRHLVCPGLKTAPPGSDCPHHHLPGV